MDMLQLLQVVMLQTGCTQTGQIVATSQDTANNYATFTYNTTSGAKTCTPTTLLVATMVLGNS